MQYPKLLFVESSLSDLLKNLVDEKTLLFTDPYNYPLVKKFGKTVMVKNNFYNISHDEIKCFVFNKVIGIGGCSALDVGRAFAEGLNFIAIPTVLSTSCISVDISILRAKDKTRKIKTVIPDKTIIPVNDILDTDYMELHKWCASGFGDLFANISAAIDYEYKRNSLSLENIYRNAKAAFEALDWVSHSFVSYDKNTICKLATFLHNSCLEVIKQGHNELSAGCEHDFYETIIRQEKYLNQVQTHGILVIIGTLISAGIYKELARNDFPLKKLKEACKKVGLPVNYEELDLAGIKKDHIIKALSNLKKKNNIISEYIIDKGYSGLDKFLY